MRILLHLLVFFSLFESLSGMEFKPVNILFIHMEDMGCQIPVYGDNTQQTPALTKLANEGMVFEKAYVTAPSCAPSRGSLFSGLYPHQNGIWAFINTHGFHYREGVPTFIKALKNAGYATGITYKTGVQPESAVPFDHIYKYNKNELGHEAGSFKVSNCIDGFEHFLQNLPKEKSFYFQAQTNDSHTPWIPKEEVIRGLKSRNGFQPVNLKRLKSLDHWNEVEMDFKTRKYLGEYYSAIQRVDYFVGKILELLEKYSYTNNTIVIFSADHGPSDLFRGKTTSYEFGLRVPFIVRWPGIIKGGQRSSQLVSFVDLMPTFLELANLPRESYLPGHSLVPIFKGQETEGREHVFSAYNSHTTGEEMYWPVRTVNNGRFKLIHNLLPRIGIEKRLGKVGMNPRIEGSFKQSKKLITNTLQPGEFELYDLENDKSESNNLVTQAEYQEVFRNLQKELKHWREKVVKDPFIQNQTLKEFTDQYYRNCKEWREKMYQGGKSNFSKNKIFLSADGWRLNMKKWIPKWNPNDYKNELIKLGK